MKKVIRTCLLVAVSFVTMKAQAVLPPYVFTPTNGVSPLAVSIVSTLAVAPQTPTNAPILWRINGLSNYGTLTATITNQGVLYAEFQTNAPNPVWYGIQVGPTLITLVAPATSNTVPCSVTTTNSITNLVTIIVTNSVSLVLTSNVTPPIGYTLATNYPAQISFDGGTNWLPLTPNDFQIRTIKTP